MGSYKCFHAVYVHILVVNCRCDVAGAFTVCNDQFLRKATSFLIYRAAREIAPTRLVICRAHIVMHAWALKSIFVPYTTY